MRILIAVIAGLAVAGAAVAAAADGPDLSRWPRPTEQNRPWARWWWPGSGVDRENLTALLGQYHHAGFGGLEICPIYGAKGYEDRYIDFLSPRWMEMLAHTTSEAKRLGMGIDLTDGTGWPFGGPNVSDEDASSRLTLKRFEPRNGRVHETLPAGRVACVRAVSAKGDQIDIGDRANGSAIDWSVPSGDWRVYAVIEQRPAQKVKRAAPGGAGNVLDPYSTAALDRYLDRFDRAFAGFGAPMPRAHFHDSFEYYGASWTGEFFEQFRKRRGYDLREHLPALFGDGTEDEAARVKHDYRETLSDLHLDYIRRWTEWAHRHGGLSRNQAHGAPGNLLDLYAAADIPETEIFGPVDDRHLPIQMLASSAAHVSGKRLASAESFTWLGEHFQTSLADLKPAADYLFLAGINHLVYHGIAYSPKDADWPGWLFYAAVDFNPNGGLWRDLNAFNGYVTRCQSVLQSGRPDNDVLLYFPVHDLWQRPDGLVEQLPIEGKWLWDTSMYASAETMIERGYAFDWMSDAQLAGARVESGKIFLGDGRYSAIVVPKAELMPPETLRKLIDMANAGGRVIFWGGLPKAVPGYGDREEQVRALNRLHDEIVGRDLPRQANTILVSDDLPGTLDMAHARREPMAGRGLRFARRSREDGWDYFVANRSDTAVNQWIALGTPAASAIILDPRFADDSEVMPLRQRGGAAEIYLALNPGESRIVRTLRTGIARGRMWRAESPAGASVPVSGRWRVEFIEGGPSRPAAFTTDALESWTRRDDTEAKRYAGTARYTLDFDRPAVRADDYVLDLGRVCESARVRVNGRLVAALWGPPYRVSIGRYFPPGRNRLEIEVTNLAANRVADLDRRGVDWKRFHEINFVGRDYKPFDASKWPLRDSGLLGPVRLVPVRRFRPNP